MPPLSFSEPVKYPPHWYADELPVWLAPFAHLVAEAWRDDSGPEPRGSYRVNLKLGIRVSANGAHSIRETSQKKVLAQLRHGIGPCSHTCSVCSAPAPVGKVRLRRGKET